MDHGALLAELAAYDGWALSMSADLRSLQMVIPMLPPDARLAAWVKPFASFKPGVNPAYAWEAVAFRSARPGRRDVPTIRDWVAASITLRRGLAGAKPDAFAWWLFDLLGAEPGDSFADLFPGTGAVGRAWETWSTSALRRIA